MAWGDTELYPQRGDGCGNAYGYVSGDGFGDGYGYGWGHVSGDGYGGGDGYGRGDVWSGDVWSGGVVILEGET